MTKNKAHDATSYAFQQGEKILLDANVWLFLQPPSAQPPPPSPVNAPICCNCGTLPIVSQELAKLSEYERQIKEGELVPVEVAVKWSREPKEICHSPRRSLRWFAGNQYRLKQFAAERAKEKA